MARRAFFLDRDGVLLPDEHLLSRPEQVCLYPGAAGAVRRLKQAGFLVLVVTNQTVIARGLATEEDVARVHEAVQAQLVAGGGERVDRFYVCPHHPRATLPAYAQACACRKPAPGMLLQAARDFGVDLRASYTVGDRVSDVIAGRRAGTTTALVQTGRHLAPPIEGVGADADLPPDFTFPDLAAAVEGLLAQAGRSGGRP
jgi:D-glycero-D-manno-heptose 1,7-bisphosphate phosphatase